jgi:hypothetical protein
VRFELTTGTVVIDDQRQDPEEKRGFLVYGAYAAERLSARFPKWAAYNGRSAFGCHFIFSPKLTLSGVEADNYAWYATARWFMGIYGTPNPAPKPPTAEDEAGDWLDAYSNDGLPSADGPGEEPDYDEVSEEEAIAFAAGQYTPNGWLRNKNLKILPLGGSCDPIPGN